MTAGGLCTDVSTIGETAFVSARGEVDLVTAADLDRALRRAEIATTGPLVVELGGVTFMDLTGLRVLLATADRLDGRLRLMPLPGPVRRLIEVTETAERLPVTR